MREREKERERGSLPIRKRQELKPADGRPTRLTENHTHPALRYNVRSPYTKTNRYRLHRQTHIGWRSRYPSIIYYEETRIRLLNSTYAWKWGAPSTRLLAAGAGLTVVESGADHRFQEVDLLGCSLQHWSPGGRRPSRLQRLCTRSPQQWCPRRPPHSPLQEPPPDLADERHGWEGRGGY